MDNATIQLSEDLARQDDVGLILRGHLHTEHALIELITFFLPIENRCDWSLISYRAKLEVAHACGLNRDVKFLLEKINTLRNTFAHKLVAGIERRK